MRKVQFANNYHYHIYNRGVDKRKIFLEDQDYYRFIHDLFEFNDLDAAINLGRRFNERGSTSIKTTKKRKKLVEIMCFCLMPNHFHLILKQIREHGITKFMHKVGTGYTMYFNKKYQRTGALFEGRFKAIMIEKDEYLIHLSRYIHMNPVELVESNWKEKGIRNWEKAIKFLEQYRWSSYLDYIGNRNFPSVISKGLLLKYFRGKEDYKHFVISWLQKDMEQIANLLLE